MPGCVTVRGWPLRTWSGVPCVTECAARPTGLPGGVRPAKLSHGGRGPVSIERIGTGDRAAAQDVAVDAPGENAPSRMHEAGAVRRAEDGDAALRAVVSEVAEPCARQRLARASLKVVVVVIVVVVAPVVAVVLIVAVVVVVTATTAAIANSSAPRTHRCRRSPSRCRRRRSAGRRRAGGPTRR